MNDLDRVIRQRIESFVGELTALVRRAALDAVSDALGRGTPATRGRARATGKKPKPGAKRSTGELARLGDRVRSHVEKHPGEGAVQIARALGVGTKDLVLPIKKLIQTGELSTKGQKRATKYFRAK